MDIESHHEENHWKPIGGFTRVQLQLQLRYITQQYATLITLHYNYNYTTLITLHYTTLHYTTTAATTATTLLYTTLR